MNECFEFEKQSYRFVIGNTLLDYTRGARVALRAFVRSRLNLFAHVNLTCLKYSQVENVDFVWFYPEHMDPIKHNSVFSCIHSLRKVFQKFFKNAFWTIVPFLLKLSFFLADFSRHEILLEHMGPKILSPVPVS